MITAQEYCKRKEILTNTRFIITETGKGFFVDGDKLYTRREFENKYPLPMSLVSHNTKNADKSKNYLSTD